MYTKYNDTIYPIHNTIRNVYRTKCKPYTMYSVYNVTHIAREAWGGGERKSGKEWEGGMSNEG